MDTTAVSLCPFSRPKPYPVPSIYSLNLNCSSSSLTLSSIIGTLTLVATTPDSNVALYQPGVKSASAKKYNALR